MDGLAVQRAFPGPVWGVSAFPCPQAERSDRRCQTAMMVRLRPQTHSPRSPLLQSRRRPASKTYLFPCLLQEFAVPPVVLQTAFIQALADFSAHSIEFDQMFERTQLGVVLFIRPSLRPFGLGVRGSCASWRLFSRRD